MSLTNIPIYTQLHRLKKVLNNGKLQHCPQDVCHLYICITLFSTIFSCSVRANPITPSPSTMQVKEMPYANKLSNPCTLVNASSLHSSNLPEETRDTTRRTLLNEIKAKAALVKDSAQTILETNVIRDCPTLVLPTVADIPLAEDVCVDASVENLRSYYTSLLNHTAYVFFIPEQIKLYSHDHTCINPGLYENARSLAAELQQLMCALRYLFMLLDPNPRERDDEDSIEQSTCRILNEELSDHSDCSKRAFRDCQTIRSTVEFLRELVKCLHMIVLDAES